MSRLLHTSDWHLGAPLVGETRTDHFQAMLAGLLKVIQERKVTCLLIAGDVFDVSNPPVSAQNQYYDFLASLRDTSCGEVVIISGNHDSARFLAAPAAALSRLGIHVVSDTETDSALVPVGDDVVVLAVPYLRDGSLETTPGASEEERSAGFINMTRTHLAGLSSLARRRYPGRRQVVMAHQFLVGSAMDNGKEEIDYVGSLPPLPSSVFPPEVDYVALGHIHKPQVVRGAMPIRYSGSPMAIDFGESGQTKQVVLVDTDPWTITPIDLPTFANLRRISGSLPELEEALDEMASTSGPVWVAATYTGDHPVAELRRNLFDRVKGTNVHLAQVLDKQAWYSRSHREEVVDLKTLTPEQVFERRLEEGNFDEKTGRMLRSLFAEILHDIANPEAME